MLILTRRPGESIHIGDNIVLVVTQVDGQAVRIGIDAPKDVHILRSELMARGGRQREMPDLADPVRMK